MPTNRPSEDRYRGGDPGADSHEDWIESLKPKPSTKSKNVVELLASPPETLVEHAERVGADVDSKEIRNIDGIVSIHYLIRWIEKPNEEKS